MPTVRAIEVERRLVELGWTLVGVACDRSDSGDSASFTREASDSLPDELEGAARMHSSALMGVPFRPESIMTTSHDLLRHVSEMGAERAAPSA